MEQERTRLELYSVYLCIVIRCIMNIKVFFVNTLPVFAYACKALAASNDHPDRVTGSRTVPHFHCRFSRVDTSQYQTAVFSSQAETVLQTYVHLDLPGCVRNIVQITIGVGSLIVYGWMNNTIIHY